MHLEHLSIRHFRCITRFEDDLSAGKILLVGDNASGKTSLLESIYYLVTGRSFRTRTDAECIPWQMAPPARRRLSRAASDARWGTPARWLFRWEWVENLYVSTNNQLRDWLIYGVV